MSVLKVIRSVKVEKVNKDTIKLEGLKLLFWSKSKRIVDKNKTQ